MPRTGVLGRCGVLGAYTVVVTSANLATSYFGLLPAGFGLSVTAGTYAAGIALGLRDALHDIGGFRWVAAGITAGVALSIFGGEARVALASAATFLLSELADLLVYIPLRRLGFRRAVVASNTIGAAADTLLFLTLAGFPLSTPVITGQLLVKAVWCTGSFLLAAEGVRRVHLVRKSIDRAGA